MTKQQKQEGWEERLLDVPLIDSGEDAVGRWLKLYQIDLDAGIEAIIQRERQRLMKAGFDKMSGTYSPDAVFDELSKSIKEE